MGGHDITAGGSNIPPWRRPESWIQPATIINSKVSGPLKEDMEQDMEAQDTEHRARRGQVMQQMAISNLKIIPTTHRIIRANMLSKFAHH